MAKGAAKSRPTRAELIAEIERLKNKTRDPDKVTDDLESHQIELSLHHQELLESQRGLEQARDRYTELFDFAPVPFVVLDAFGLIEQANRTASVFFGVSRLRLCGSPLTSHAVGDEARKVMGHMASCRRGQARVETEVTLRTARGDVDVRIITAPTVAEGKGGGRFHAAIIDLTESRRAEIVRAEAEVRQMRMLEDQRVAQAANQAKDRFLATLSHELRTPLTPILLALNGILDSDQVLPPDVQYNLDMMRRNVRIEIRLIDDLLDMTRIVQGKMSLIQEVVDVHEVIQDVLALCKEEIASSRVRMNTDLTAERHHCLADPARLRQVFWNLLRNAIRNTPAKTQIQVRTRNADADRLEIVFRDHGRGIDVALLPRLFELFEQDEVARQQGAGLGLGLPISKGIVEAHGGTIEAASAGLGQGAMFTVTLETHEPGAPIPEAKAAPHLDRAKRILLVEDNEDTAWAIAGILKMQGFEVEIAHSLREARPILSRTDILISDIGLPDGRGHELLRENSGRRPIRAIALSGYGAPADVAESVAAGFERHLVKPVEMNALLEAVSDLCRESGNSGSS